MNKIRLLLADDEPVILRGLTKLLPWHDMGVEIVGEAYDGSELREMINTTDPDLIISDISMPGSSGIDILREINDAHRPIKVVFISAYRDFTYAQDAVKYGAVDYLVKPVNKDQLEQVMYKAIRMIGEATEGLRNKEMAARFERQKRDETFEALLIRLTDGDKRAADKLQELGLVPSEGQVTVCLITLDNLIERESRWQDQERKLIDFALSNVIEEIIGTSQNRYYFRKREYHGLLIYHDRPEAPFELADDIRHQINRFLKVSISIGMGESVNRMEDADVSAFGAAEAIKLNYFKGRNQILTFGQTKGQPEAVHQLEDIQRRILHALTTSPPEQDEQLATELLVTVKRLAGDSKPSLISALYAALVHLQRQMADFGIPATTVESEFPDLLEALNRCSSFEGLREPVLALLIHLRHRREEQIGNKELVMLTQVKNYIEDHYADNITLESISALVYMNPYYFSSFFKKHTGINFKTHLTEIRMKHALRLLLHTEFMIYEIAERVGYNNARHFSDMFKKAYGKLPVEYKQAAKGQG